MILRPKGSKRAALAALMLLAAALPTGPAFAARSPDPSTSPSDAMVGEAVPVNSASGGTVQPKVVDMASLPVAAAAGGASERVPLRVPDPALYASEKSKAESSAAAAAAAARQAPDVAGDSATVSAAATDAPAEAAADSAGPVAEVSASAPGGSTPTGSTKFLGLSESGWTPPDTQIAAGTKNLVEAVNERLAIYSKSGSLLAGPYTFQSFFGTTGSVFDPAIVWRGGRFYLTAMRAVQSTSTTGSSILFMAVSRGADPIASGWCVYAFNSSSNFANNDWADNQRLGATANRILVSTNNYGWSSGYTETIHVFKKADLDACGGTTYWHYWGFLDGAGNAEADMAPALDYDSSSSTLIYFVATRWYGGTAYEVWRATASSDGATNTLGFTRYTIGSNSYAIPPGARQPNTSTRIDTADARMMQTVVKRYNVIWASHDTALNPGCGFNIAAIHLIGVNAPASSSVAPSAYYDYYYWADCNLDYYFPAGSIDGNGNMLFAFNRSSTAEYPNWRFSGWTYAQMPGQTVAGLYGSTRIGNAPCACNNFDGRWGDYSGASLDPSSQDFIWTAGEIQIATSTWGTQIGKIYHKVTQVP